MPLTLAIPTGTHLGSLLLNPISILPPLGLTDYFPQGTQPSIHRRLRHTHELLLLRSIHGSTGRSVGERRQSRGFFNASTNTLEQQCSASWAAQGRHEGTPGPAPGTPNWTQHTAQHQANLSLPQDALTSSLPCPPNASRGQRAARGWERPLYDISQCCPCPPCILAHHVRNAQNLIAAGTTHFRHRLQLLPLST